MIRTVLCVIVAGFGCSKSERPSREPPPLSSVPPPEPAVAPPRSPFGGARLVVDASSVTLDSVALGTSPTAAQLAKLPRDAVALAFTDDAPADRVLGVVAALHGAGHARVDLTALVAGAPKIVCAATPTPAAASAVQLVLGADHGVAIGLEGALAVFSHARATAIPLDHELATPFFADATALAVAAAPASRADDLAALLDVACRRRAAVRAIPVPPRPEMVLKPLCRKVIPKGAFDADRLREAMPSLYAMASAANARVFAPLRRIMDERDATRGVAAIQEQLALVDQMLQAPSVNHPLWDVVAPTMGDFPMPAAGMSMG